MSEKPEALRLADAMWAGRLDYGIAGEIAAELRRQHAEIERLEDDNEALRRDAERYRWLRENAYVWGSNEYVRSDMQIEAVAIWLLGTTDMTDPGIDAAIDAAMEPATEPAIGARRQEVPR